MAEFKPTWLMIKRHSVTGLQYFCKTTQNTLKNAIKYHGSGLHWKKHIKKHGREFVTTEWISLFYDKDECLTYAVQFSEDNDIVVSDAWSNLVIETGLDRGESRPMPDTVKEKISNAKKGIPLSEEHKEKLKKPHNFTYAYTDEHKEKLSKTKRGKEISQGHREKLRIANIGHKHTEESKQKMVASRTGKKINRSSKMVQRFDENWNFIDENTTIEYALLGYAQCRISICCNDNTKKHKKYYWKYKI